MELENDHIKNYLFKVIADKYFVADNNSGFLEKFKHHNKFRYYEAKLSKNPKYPKKELTYGLKFGANKVYWIIISFSVLVSAKMFYDLSNKTDWSLSGMMIMLGFFLFILIFSGYKILFEYPIIEIQKNKLIYQKKEYIMWDNIILVGIIINRSGKPPYDRRIVLGTKQKQLKELKVSFLDSDIQNLVDIILKNVA